MKKLFIALMLFAGIASFAQEAAPKPTSQHKEKLTPEQRSEKQLKKLTSELNLDANQQTKVKQLLADRNAKAEKFKEERKARKASNVKPTAAEKEAFKKQMIAERDENDAKMKAILNADQYNKWKTIQKENQDKMKDKMKEQKDME